MLKHRGASLKKGSNGRLLLLPHALGPLHIILVINVHASLKSQCKVIFLQIRVGGKDIDSFQLKWLRSQIGVVSQEPILFSGTIAENIQYGNEKASLQEIEQAAWAANAHMFINKLPQVGFAGGIVQAYMQHGFFSQSNQGWTKFRCNLGPRSPISTKIKSQM